MPPLVSDNNVTVEPSSSDCCPEPSTDAASDSKFVLPDLNIPFGEEAPCPDVTCGVS
ncbi:UNVERIFIED_CONTAM: hypothetical protein Sangu_0100800 [Sesamum angustifolium]|uniref:Uncharacterized protein n=1 Tax=Sesamum angustifolium TaxID=2727405 RepID=A0AAW2RK38_9LAMI